MSKGETWKCDGKRKDGGTHPNLSCTGQNDEIDINDECECGLTKAQIHPSEISTTKKPDAEHSSSEKTGKTSGNKNKAILIFLLTLVTGSLAALFWFRCQIFSGICPPPPCETTESVFNNVLSRGKSGISSFDNAKNIQETKTAQASLTTVINDLGNIRASCPFYKEVQNNRVMYQSQLLKMDAEIANEEKAKKLFDEASAVKPQIQGKIERAKTNADLGEIKEAKKLVEDAIKKLQTIPPNRFIAKNADDLLNEYQNMVKDFDRQIQSYTDAKKLFDEAKTIKPQLKEKIDRAKKNIDLEEIKNARGLVNDGIRKLKDIPPNTLISKDVDELLKEYQDKLNDFDRQIDRGCVEGNIGICLKK